MTTALLTRRAAHTAAAGTRFRAARTAPVAQTTTAVAASRPETLADVVADAWDGLVFARGAACVVCGGHMSPRYGASACAPVGGRCDDCGSTLG